MRIFWLICLFLFYILVFFLNQWIGVCPFTEYLRELQVCLKWIKTTFNFFLIFFIIFCKLFSNSKDLTGKKVLSSILLRIWWKIEIKYFNFIYKIFKAFIPSIKLRLRIRTYQSQIFKVIRKYMTASNISIKPIIPRNVVNLNKFGEIGCNMLINRIEWFILNLVFVF